MFTLCVYVQTAGTEAHGDMEEHVSHFVSADIVSSTPFPLFLIKWLHTSQNTTDTRTDH